AVPGADRTLETDRRAERAPGAEACDGSRPQGPIAPPGEPSAEPETDRRAGRRVVAPSAGRWARGRAHRPDRRAHRPDRRAHRPDRRAHRPDRRALRPEPAAPPGAD